MSHIDQLSDPVEALAMLQEIAGRICGWRGGRIGRGRPSRAADVLARSIVLKRAIKKFAVISDGKALIDTRRGRQIGLQTFDPLEQIKSHRAALLAAIDYYVEILGAADFRADDLVGLPHRRRMPEVLNEVRIRTDAGDPPYARNDQKSGHNHDAATVLTIEIADLREPDVQPVGFLP